MAEDPFKSTPENEFADAQTAATEIVRLDSVRNEGILGQGAVEPTDGFVNGPDVPDQTDPGFTPDLSDKQIEKQLGYQRILANGMVLMGEAPPPVDWKAIDSWQHGECRDIVSPHFNSVCKYDPALDKSNWKNPDLAAEAGHDAPPHNWDDPDKKGPGTFGMGGGA